MFDNLTNLDMLQIEKNRGRESLSQKKLQKSNFGFSVFYLPPKNVTKLPGRKSLGGIKNN